MWQNNDDKKAPVTDSWAVKIVNVTVNTDLLDCGPAPAVPCVVEGGCECQQCPLQPPPCPELKMPSRRAGGQWAGMEGSEVFPAVTQAMPDDSHRLGVLIPPTKRQTDVETQEQRGEEADGHRDKDNQRKTCSSFFIFLRKSETQFRLGILQVHYSSAILMNPLLFSVVN